MVYSRITLMLSSKEQKEQVIILGASGFIGKALQSKFLNCNIRVKGFSSKDVDLTNPNCINFLKPFLEKNTILVFVSAKVREKGDSLVNYAQNVSMAENVSKILKVTRIKKCIFLSSVDVYGYPVEKVTEDTKLDPKTFYAASKISSEQILKIACDKSNTTFLVLRFGGIFGPGLSADKYGPNSFIYTLLKRNVVEIWGDGTELRNFVYICDLVEIIFLLSLNKAKGVINIVTGESLSFKKIVEILYYIHKAHFKIIRKRRTSKKFDQVFHPELFKSTLPNFNFTDIRQALKETYNNTQV